MKIGKSGLAVLTALIVVGCMASSALAIEAFQERFDGEISAKRPPCMAEWRLLIRTKKPLG